jgi:hypothetical protein
MDMSKMIELSDEQYRIIEQAATRGQTPDAFLAQLIEELRDRTLGTSSARITGRR